MGLFDNLAAFGRRAADTVAYAIEDGMVDARDAGDVVAYTNRLGRFASIGSKPVTRSGGLTVASSGGSIVTETGSPLSIFRTLLDGATKVFQVKTEADLATTRSKTDAAIAVANARAAAATGRPIGTGSGGVGLGNVAGVLVPLVLVGVGVKVVSGLFKKGR